MKRIYLFTSRFPYGTGENFIEDEIKELNDVDFRLIIVPFKINSYCRGVPKNVTIDKTVSVSFTWRLIKSIFSFWVIKNLVNIHKSVSPPQNLKQVNSSIKFLIGANIIREYIREILLKDGDILYSYWFNHVPLGLVEGVKRFHKNKNIKIVSRAHGYDVYDKERNMYFPYREETFEALDKLFCISNHGKDYLSKKLDSTKIEVSCLGVWYHEFIPHSKDNKSNEINFVSCSSVIPVKRVTQIFKCINQFSKYSKKKISWTHYGGGDLLDELSELIKNREENLTVILKGHIPKSDIEVEYSKGKYDIFVNLSESEGIPVSIMEAISFGIPVIATDVGGTPEILDGGAGIGIGSNVNTLEFIHAVENILANYDCFVDNALKTFNEKYNASSNYPNFYNILLNL